MMIDVVVHVAMAGAGFMFGQHLPCNFLRLRPEMVAPSHTVSSVATDRLFQLLKLYCRTGFVPASAQLRLRYDRWLKATFVLS